MASVKCYCLDVRGNPWRTEVVQQRFKDAGLEVERFEGVHGQTIGVMPTRTVWDAERENPYRISPGHVTITFNKLMLFQKALDDPAEVAIIFENDVRLCDNFKEEFAKSCEKLPSDWEVVHIGHCCSEGKPTTVINDRVSEIHWPLCCHAFMWKKSALKLAIEVFKTSCWGTPSDVILQHKVYPKVRHYCFTPQLAFQDSGPGEAVKSETYLDFQGWTSPCYIQIFNEQLTGFGRGKATVVEVGCFKGRSTAYIAEEIKRRHKNVDFYAVDTWEGNADEPDMVPLVEAAKAEGGLYQMFIRNMCRAGVMDYVKPMRMTSVEASKKFEDRSVNFCYIDAGHSYADVMADLQAWYPKMVPTSCLAGHDIARPDVRRAVTEFSASVGKPFREFEESWLLDNCNH